MTTMLKLVWRYTEQDYLSGTPSTDIDTLDLLSYTEGINLAENGWVPNTAIGDEASVIEVITLRLDSDTIDNLAAVVHDLDEYKKRVAWSVEDIARRGVFLRTQMGAETYLREAMVYSLEYKLGTPLLDICYTDEERIDELIITLERAPYWEPQTYISTVGDSDILSISDNGGQQILSNLFNGDVPARIERLAIYSDDTYAYRKAWFGIRTTRFGVTLANVESVWDLTDADSGSFDADTTLSGDHLVTTFGLVQALITRATIQIQDVTVNTEDQIGTFLVLLRAAVTAGSNQIRARIRYGFAPPAGGVISNPAYRSRVPITSANPMLYEMGNVTFTSITGSLSLMSISIDADRTGTGSANLHLYELILIPVDEGAIAFESNIDIDNNHYVAAWARPNGRLIAYNIDGAYGIPDRSVQSVCKVTAENWGMPANSSAPLVVFAAQGASDHDTSKTATIEYIVANRWRTLRGSELGNTVT